MNGIMNMDWLTIQASSKYKYVEHLINEYPSFSYSTDGFLSP